MCLASLNTRVVIADEIDRLGHVNNLAYLAWMQAAALAHSAAQGWPPERYEQLGAGWVVRSHEIKYLQSAYEGERIVVRTWVADMSKVGSTAPLQDAARRRPVPVGLGLDPLGVRRLSPGEACKKFPRKSCRRSRSWTSEVDSCGPAAMRRYSH